MVKRNCANDNCIECKSEGVAGLSTGQYLEKLRPFLRDMIGKSDEWKIQLTMKAKFMSSTDSTILKKRTMHTTSDNAEVMIGKDTDEIILELFDSLLDRYQEGLEEFMEGSGFAFDHVDGLR